MSADAVREAGVVPDHRAVSSLAAGNTLFQHDRLQALKTAAVGRSRSDDDDIALVDIAANAPAHCRDDLSERRFDHRVAVVPDHDRKA